MNNSENVQLTIDGNEVSVPKGTTIYDAAKTVGIDIPVLCHLPGIDPIGVCRVCAVDVGARVYAAACIREVEPGMEVKTNTEPVQHSRKVLLELLLADHPIPCEKHKENRSCELELLAEKEHVDLSNNRFAPPPTERIEDHSSHNIAVDLNACILCDRCIRACSDVKENFIIGRADKGYDAHISFDNGLPMGESDCVTCGECLVSCPTGALTNVGFGATLEGEKFDIYDLCEIPIFKGISPAFLQRNEGGVVKRHFKKDEIICREGEFGTSAFYILEGEVDIYISSPVRKSEAKDETALFGLIRKIGTRLQGKPSKPSKTRETRIIPIDATVDLAMDNPTATLKEGDLFGEQSVLNNYPRGATVRAAGDCTVIELLRPVFLILQKNPAFKQEMDKKYRERALTYQLNSMSILDGLSSEFIDKLRDKVKLIQCNPGTVIFEEGDVADALYIVRLGFVRVKKTFPGGEITLAYLHKGSFFGEMGLLDDKQRTATCIALDHVELVRIDKVDFDEMLEEFPDVRAQFVMEMKNREAQTKAITEIEQTTNVPMKEFLDQGLMKAQSLLLLDLDKCVRCDECVRACADAHDGVTRLVRDGLRFDKYLVATACRSCTDPLCMIGCPVGSIRRKESLEIVIEDWCVGCGLCAEQCPYGNINLHPFSVTENDPKHPEASQKAVMRNKATVCDLCTDHEEPSCVYACPHDAAHRVNGQTFFTTEYLKQGSGGK